VALIELNKLHNISLNLSSVVVFETAWTVSVKHSHRTEVCTAHAHDDDGARHRTQFNDERFCFLHIMDSTISQQKEHRIGWLALLTFDNLHEALKNVLE
jgi:hypothetical protein